MWFLPIGKGRFNLGLRLFRIYCSHHGDYHALRAVIVAVECLQVVMANLAYRLKVTVDALTVGMFWVKYFPEGQRGFIKPYSEAYELQSFGLGFMRMALQTGTPIVPVGIVGSEELLLPADGSPATAQVRAAATEAGPRLFTFRVAALPDEMREVLDCALQECPKVSWYVDLAVASIHGNELPALPANVVADAQREGYVVEGDRVGVMPWIVLALIALAVYAYCS